MLQLTRIRFIGRACCPVVLACGFLLAAGPLLAQTPPATLKQAFELVWAKQPEAQSLALRQEAAEARKQVAESWLAEPPALELSDKTDRLNKNQGGREYVAGIAFPLWLPGERSRSGALAEAEIKATASRARAAQLRVAAILREAWWEWQRAGLEYALARERLENARRLASDVARRVRAGDLARSDQHQADGAAASAEASLAEAAAYRAATAHGLRALTGTLPSTLPAIDAIDAIENLAPSEPVPVVPADLSQSSQLNPLNSLDQTHPSLVELLDRVEVARRGADLASVQTRENPELTLGTSRERGVFGEAYQQSVMVGVRIPFSSESRHRAKVGLARAEAIEAEGQLRIERERLRANAAAARSTLDSVRQRLRAAEKRARLARESRGFFEKSFRLGESDLPTRLRIELEAAEAERQALRARIELASAISTLRQALGLLPE